MTFGISPLQELQIDSAVITVLSLLALWFRFWSKRLITAVAGLHANVFLFLGVGPLLFTFYESEHERLPLPDLIEAMATGASMFLIGYIFVVALDLWFERPAQRVSYRPIVAPPTSWAWIILLLVFSASGYAVTALGGGTMGAGTIFPLLKNFLYPVTMLVVLRFDRKDVQSALLCSGVLLFGLFVSLRSAWRSELIMFLGSMGLAMLLRSPKSAAVFFITGAATLFVLIPFQNYKKANYEETSRSLAQAFRESQSLNLQGRTDTVKEFFGIRVNSTREMGYVLKGVEYGDVDSRDGATYWEALLQLIPRLVWQDKPSFNQFTGYYLSRAIGLVGLDDENTSWGVNLFAEFLVNFPAAGLVLFVPLVFLLFLIMDRFMVRVFSTPAAFWLMECSLFFLCFQLVGVVNAATFYLWTFIFVFALDRFAPHTRRPVQNAYVDAKSKA